MTEAVAVEVWVLADDRAGNVGQCVGVAEALGRPFAVKPIRYDRFGRLPNLVRGAGLLGVDAASRSGLMPPWPRVVIAAGRRTAPVARWIKRQCGAFLVQIMDPGAAGRGEFDLVAVPRHDRPRPAANQLIITGAPHRVTAARLAAEAELWRSRFAHLPRPWVAVMVGGATRQRPFPVELAAELGRRAAVLAQGGSVLLTTSRRTGSAQEQALLAAIPEPRYAHLWSAHLANSSGDNPYFGFLALADAIVVTGDSVSMCCEACAAPAPVYVFAPPGFAVPKHARLHAELYELAMARPLEAGTTLQPSRHPPLTPALDVAAAIRARLGA